MFDDEAWDTDERQRPVSTGLLPSEEEVVAVVVEAYERYRGLRDGTVADYIPALAKASADQFGICLVGVRGRAVAIGDADRAFSMQSISKVFTFALVCEEIGYRRARDLLGVNSTGLPFNSVMAIELNVDRTINPMVNAGAIATTSLVPGVSATEKFGFVIEGLSRFAGRTLSLDEEVYESEAATNFRNRGIAHLLDSYGRMYCDPDVATDIYTRQCSLAVSARDLAVMAATLGDGGVNPLTGDRVIGQDACRAGARGARHRRPVRALRGLAVRGGAARQERRQWWAGHRLPGKGGVGHLLPASRRCRQQRPWPAGHPLRVRPPGPEPVRLFPPLGLTQPRRLG